MDVPRDTSAHRPYVRLVGKDRRLLPHAVVGRLNGSLPPLEAMSWLAVHTGAVF
jgi:hypothetical protein